MQERTDQNMTDKEMITLMLFIPGSVQYSMQKLLKDIERSDNKEQYKAMGASLRLALAEKLDGLIKGDPKLTAKIKKLFGEADTSTIIKVLSGKGLVNWTLKKAIKAAIPAVAQDLFEQFQLDSYEKSPTPEEYEKEIKATFKLIELLCLDTVGKTIEQLKDEETTYLIAGLLPQQPEAAPERSAGAAAEAEVPAPESSAAEEDATPAAEADTTKSQTSTPKKLQQELDINSKQMDYFTKQLTDKKTLLANCEKAVTTKEKENEGWLFSLLPESYELSMDKILRGKIEAEVECLERDLESCSTQKERIMEKIDIEEATRRIEKAALARAIEEAALAREIEKAARAIEEAAKEKQQVTESTEPSSPKKESLLDRILKAFGFKKQSLLPQDVGEKAATEAKPSLLARFIAMVKGLIEKALHVNESDFKPQSKDNFTNTMAERAETEENQNPLRRGSSLDRDPKSLSQPPDKGPKL